MRTIPAVAIIVGGWGAAACDGENRCETLTVEDTVEVYESDGRIMVMAQRDTQPKPYARCLTLRAARDTQPRP